MQYNTLIQMLICLLRYGPETHTCNLCKNLNVLLIVNIFICHEKCKHWTQFHLEVTYKYIFQ